MGHVVERFEKEPEVVNENFDRYDEAYTLGSFTAVQGLRRPGLLYIANSTNINNVIYRNKGALYGGIQSIFMHNLALGFFRDMLNFQSGQEVPEFDGMAAQMSNIIYTAPQNEEMPGTRPVDVSFTLPVEKSEKVWTPGSSETLLGLYSVQKAKRPEGMESLIIYLTGQSLIQDLNEIHTATYSKKITENTTTRLMGALLAEVYKNHN
jgi:hypothetical protein